MEQFNPLRPGDLKTTGHWIEWFNIQDTNLSSIARELSNPFYWSIPFAINRDDATSNTFNEDAYDNLLRRSLV